MLTTSGPISLLDLQSEFAGSNPIGLDEYYRGGGIVDSGTLVGSGSFQTAPLTPDIDVLVPTSGTIQMSQFYGTQDVLVGNSGLITAPPDSAAVSDYVEVTLPASVNYIRLFLVGGGGGGGGPNQIGGGHGGGGSVLHGTISTAWAGDVGFDRTLRFYVGRGGAYGYYATGNSITSPAPRGGHGYGMYGVTYPAAWSTWMNSYAVGTDMAGSLYAVSNQRTSRMVYFSTTMSYQFQFLADNALSLEVDGSVVADTYGLNDQGQNTLGSYAFASPLTRSVSVSAGWHKITFVYSNAGSVGAFAVRIMQGASQIWSTRDEYNTWIAHPAGGMGGYSGSTGASGYGGAGGSGTMVTIVTSAGEYFLALAGGGGGGGGGGDSGVVNVSVNANWCNQGWTTAYYYPPRTSGGDGEYLGALNNDPNYHIMTDGGGGGGGGGGITNDRQYVMNVNKQWVYSGFGGRTLRGNLLYNDTLADGGESGKSGITAFATRYADVMHIPTTSRFPIWPTSVVGLTGTSLTTLATYGRGGNASTPVLNATAGGNGVAYVDWGSTGVNVTAPPVTRAPVAANIINYTLTGMPVNGGPFYDPLHYYFQAGTGQNQFYLDAFGGGGNPGSEYTYTWTNASGAAVLTPQSTGRCLVAANDIVGSGQIQCTVSDGTSSAVANFYWYGVYPDPPPDTGGSTCFPAGSMVLMANKTLKPIEQVVVGEMVMAPNGPTRVIGTETPYLGLRKLLQLSDGHTWSEEHTHWTRADDGTQWWWSSNPDSWRSEVEQGLFGGLLDNSTLRTGSTGFEFAHMDGWKREVPKEIPGEYSMPLYFIRTNGAPVIIDGYVVGAGPDESAFDYTTLDWDVARVFIESYKTDGLAVQAGEPSRQPPEPPPAERPPVIDPDFEPAPILTDPGLTPDVLP